MLCRSPSRSLLVTLGLLGTLTSAAYAEVQPLLLEARVDLEARTIHGTLELELQRPAEKLVFALFPNRFASDEGTVDDMTRYYVYPSGTFSPGGIQILAASGRDDAEGAWHPLDLRRLSPPGAPQHSFLEVMPGSASRIRLRFVTQVPERYGPFGATEYGLTAVGGWYPSLVARAADGTWQFHAPPPPSRINGHIVVQSGAMAVIGNTIHPAGHAERLPLSDIATRSLSLIVFTEGREIEAEVPGTRLRFAAPAPRRAGRIGFGEESADLFRAAVASAIEKAPTAIPRPADLTIVQVPLRWDLTAISDGPVVASDRAMHVNFLLQGFHEGQIAQAVYASMVRPRALACEASGDREWTTQAIAWELSLRLLEETQPLHRGVTQWMDRLDIFAIIDRFERAPKVPFANAFFENARSRDELHQSIFTWMMQRAPAPLGLARLDREFGDDAVRRATDAWIAASEGSCLTFAEALANSTSESPDEAEAALTAALAPPGPVTPHTRVDLDLAPRHPRSKYQFVLDSADVDISSSELGFTTLFVLRERGDYRRGLALQPWLTEKSWGFRAGAHFHWGTPNDASSFRNNLFAFYQLAELRPDFTADNQPDIRDGGAVGGFGIRYDYSNAWWHDNPTDKRQYRLFFDGYNPALGGHWSFLRWGARARASTTLFSENTVFAAEFLTGFTHATNDRSVPIQEQYSLGGSKALRGVSVNQEVARNIGLARFELRQEVFPEVDLNLFDIVTYRRPQLRVFIDTGGVDNSAGHALNPAHWAISGGIGIGARYDFLGFFPGLAYIEFATRFDRDQANVQFLFGTRQAF
jgi:hypothetical protein